jgi:hypothetical protein
VFDGVAKGNISHANFTSTTGIWEKVNVFFVTASILKQVLREVAGRTRIEAAMRSKAFGIFDVYETAVSHVFANLQSLSAS